MVHLNAVQQARRFGIRDATDTRNLVGIGTETKSDLPDKFHLLGFLQVFERVLLEETAAQIRY